MRMQSIRIMRIVGIVEHGKSMGGIGVACTSTSDMVLLMMMLLSV